MIFECKNNPFLASVLNSKKMKEITFRFNKNGKVIFLTNIEILHHFLKNSNKNQLKTIQNLLARSNYSVSEINFFAKSYARDYMLK